MARNDYYASPFGATYSAYMERPRLGRLIAGAVWGGDIQPYYDSMRAVGEVAAGGTIVDCPCGAGPALRELRRGSGVRYVAVDLSPAMARRTRERARARKLAEVEVIEASADDLPLPTDLADLFLSYWGLHCFEDPGAALAEAARVLRPGGRLLGATFVRGTGGRRPRLLLRPHRGDFGPIGTEADVGGWLRAAGLQIGATQRSGPMLFFDAGLPG